VTTLATEAVEQAVAPERESKEESLNYASQLPEPKGYKLLIALPKSKKPPMAGSSSRPNSSTKSQ
jgi:hypothetical protein